MQRFIYKFSFFIGVIALITALASGVSLITSVIRASLVLLGTMTLFVVALHVIRWAIISTTVIEHHEMEEEKQKQHKINLNVSGDIKS